MTSSFLTHLALRYKLYPVCSLPLEKDLNTSYLHPIYIQDYSLVCILSDSYDHAFLLIRIVTPISKFLCEFFRLCFKIYSSSHFPLQDDTGLEFEIKMYWPSSCCVLSWPFPVPAHLCCLFVFINQAGLGPILMISFNFNYLFKGPICKYSHVGS